MQTFTLDITNKEIVPLLNVKQKDIGKKISITITDNGKAYTIPSGASFSVWFSGKSGDGHYDKIGNKSAFSVQGSTVTVELILQMLNNPGVHSMCLVMNDASGNQLGLWNIPYYVEALPGANSEPATKYFENLEAAQEAADRAENAAKSVESLKPLHVTVGQNGKANYNGEEIFNRAYYGGDVYLTPYGSQESISLSEFGQEDSKFVSTSTDGTVTIYEIDRAGNSYSSTHLISELAFLVEILEDGKASADPVAIRMHAEVNHNVFFVPGLDNYVPLSYLTNDNAYFTLVDEEAGVIDVFRIDSDCTVNMTEYFLSSDFVAPLVVRSNNGVATTDSDSINRYWLDGQEVYFEIDGAYIHLTYSARDKAMFSHTREDGITEQYVVNDEAEVKKIVGSDLVVTLKEDGTKASHTSEEIALHASNGGAVRLWNAVPNTELPLSYNMQDEATFAHIGENGIVTSYVIDRDGGVRTWIFDLNNSGGGGGGDSVEHITVRLSTENGQTTADYTATDIEQHALHGGLVFLNPDNRILIPLSFTDGNYASFRHGSDDDKTSVEYVIYRDGTCDIYHASYADAVTKQELQKAIEPLIVELLEDGKTANYNAQQIRSFAESGGNVYCKDFDGDLIQLTHTSEHSAFFTKIDEDGFVYTYEIGNDSSVHQYYWDFRGNTPIKGKDYWTEEDKAEMVADVIAALPVYNGEVL